jgi:hypothetical protein
MNEKSQILFRALLKNALWETPLNYTFEPTTEQWNQIMAFARKQTVTALIAESILRHEQMWHLEDTLKKKLQMTVIRNVQDHERLNRVLAEVVDLLSKHNIRAVLLKGQGVAQNYLKPNLRCCGDIDLYIGAENYEKACNIVADIVDNLDDALESHKHLHLEYKGVTVELHLIAERLDGKKRNDYLHALTIDTLEKGPLPFYCFNGVNVYVPADAYNAFYIFEHLWHHFLTSGIGLRQICDWTRFLHVHKDTIDRTRLERDLKHLGLWYPWLIFASIAVEQIGLPAEECPFYNVLYSGEALRIMRMITREGNFGKYSPERLNKEPKSYISRKFSSFQQQTRRYILLSRIFPREILIRYGYFLSNSLRRVLEETYKKNPDAPHTIRRK